MSHVTTLNIGARLQIAKDVAGFFTHKFDFSEKKHFDDWAGLAFQAADALIELADVKQAAAQKKDDEENAAIEKARQAKDLRDKLARETA